MLHRETQRIQNSSQPRATSDHFDGLRYFNPPLDGGLGHAEGFGAFLKWQRTRKQGAWRKWTPNGPVHFPAATVGQGELRLTFVGHSTWLIQTGGVNLLTDPVWSVRIGPRLTTLLGIGPRRHRPPALPFDALPKIHLILLSHNHYDHLDRPTLRTLTRVHSPAIIAPCGVSRTLPITTRRSTRELDWWQQTEIGGLRIMCVPARHFSARSLRDRNHSLWCGFVIETAAPRGDSAANFISREWRPAVYFAGDTGWGKHFAEIGDRFPGITTALLPIGAYLPRWFMAPVHLAPDEAVNAQHAIGARLAFAMHFGTFALADDGEDEPVQALAEARKASPADFRVPQPGIAVAFRLDGAGELRESTA